MKNKCYDDFYPFTAIYTFWPSDKHKFYLMKNKCNDNFNPFAAMLYMVKMQY